MLQETKTAHSGTKNVVYQWQNTLACILYVKVNI